MFNSRSRLRFGLSEFDKMMFYTPRFRFGLSGAVCTDILI
jgi:hypothetical protein